MENMDRRFLKIVSILNRLGFKVFIIGTRALKLRGLSLNRGTEDWDIFIDRSYIPEVRDILTKEFRPR